MSKRKPRGGYAAPDRPVTAADLPEVPAGPAQGARYPTIGTVCECLRCGGEKQHGRPL